MEIELIDTPGLNSKDGFKEDHVKSLFFDVCKNFCGF